MTPSKDTFQPSFGMNAQPQVCGGRSRTGRGVSLVRPRGTALAALAVAGALSPSSGGAFEARDLLAFNAGPVVVKPRFTFVAGYSDNVYYLPDDSPLEQLGIIKSREDFNFVLSPELRARLGREGGDRQLNFSYRFNQYLFVENTDSDSSNHAFSLGGQVAGSRLEYDTQNSMQFLNSIISGYELVEAGIVIPGGNVERNQYSTSHNLAYVLSAKSRLRLEGSASFQEYPGQGFQQARYYDSTDWRLRAGYDYALSQKLRLAGLAHYGQQLRSARGNLPSQTDADIFGGSISASGSFTAKLSGNVRLGYEHREFERGDSDGYTLVGLGLNQQFTEKTSASLNYNRSGSVSASTGGGTVTDGVGLGFQQVIGTSRPWFLNLNVDYRRTEYADQDLTLEHFRVTVGAAYRLRQWATAFINYSFELGERQAFDYEVNQVNLGLTIGL